jgi:hypothetical protein
MIQTFPQKSNLGTDFFQLEIDRNSAGWISGGEFVLTAGSTLLQVNAGYGRAFNGTKYIHFHWLQFDNNIHVANTYNYVYVKYDGTLLISAVATTSNQYVRLGKLWWDPLAGIFTSVWWIPLVVGDYQTVMDNWVGGIGATINGVTVTEKAIPNQRELIFSAGTMHVRLTDYTINTTSNFWKIYQCSDLFIVRDIIHDDNIVDTTLWADKTKPAATALTVMTLDFWAKALIVVNVKGEFYFVYPEAEYATEASALAAPLPLISILLADDNACVCMIVYKKGDTSIATRITDIRPNWQRIFGTALFSAGGASTAHNALANLDYASAGHTGFQPALGYTPENVANIRTSFQAIPDNTHYPSEKLVKDSLDAITINPLDGNLIIAMQVFGG